MWWWNHTPRARIKPFSLLLPLKGGRGCLMFSPLFGISGLSFDASFLSPLIFLHSLSLGMFPSKVPQSAHLGYSAILLIFLRYASIEAERRKHIENKSCTWKREVVDSMCLWVWPVCGYTAVQLVVDPRGKEVNAGFRLQDSKCLFQYWAVQVPFAIQVYCPWFYICSSILTAWKQYTIPRQWRSCH